MKKIIVLILLGLFTVYYPLSTVSAHIAGQPPFFKINGEYSDLYPVPTSSVTNFDLPQDIAKKNHFVGEVLEIEMDVNQLPILPEVIDNTQFIWDFGDGTAGVGLKNTHTYTKQGSYILRIEAKYRTDEPQLIQSTLINVLPDANYKLPVAQIIVNGKEAKDPLTYIIYVDFKNEIEFNSSKSLVNGQIMSYYWDLGDGKSSVEANPRYKYDAESMQMFPVLRITDNNGFFADAFVQIESDEKSNTENSSFIFVDRSFRWIIMIGLVILIVFGGIWFVKRPSKK